MFIFFVMWRWLFSLYLIRCKYKKLCSNYSFSNYLESIKIKVLRLTLMRFITPNIIIKTKCKLFLFLCKHVQNLHLFKSVFLKYPIYGIQRDWVSQRFLNGFCVCMESFLCVFYIPWLCGTSRSIMCMHIM